jgi:pilus assembly protein CpaB
MKRRVAIILLLLVVVVGVVVVGGLVFLLPTMSSGSTASGQEGQEGEPPARPTEEAQVPVIIADIDIPANTLITDTEMLLAEEDIPQRQFNAQSGNFVTSVLDVEGKLLTRAVNAGDFINPDDLVEPGLSQRIPEGEDDEPRPKAYPLEVNSLTGVADQITQGDFVDIVATYEVERFVQITTQRTEPRIYFTTKTIIQRAEVLRILRPSRSSPESEGGSAPPPGEDVAVEGEPQVDESGRPIERTQPSGATSITGGNWMLVLALTDQEIEALEYTRFLEEGAEIALALRGAGDEELEDTLGATFEILQRDFDVPQPGPQGPIFDEADLNP